MSQHGTRGVELYLTYIFVTAWFIGVQVLMTFALVTGIVGVVVLPMAGADTEDNTIQWISTAISGFQCKYAGSGP